MEERIRLYLKEVAYEKGVEFDNLTDLFSVGILDSFGFIMLLTYIQDEFGIEFSEDDMKAENFASLDRIVEFCEKKS